jgi:hypothetical protein
MNGVSSTNSEDGSGPVDAAHSSPEAAGDGAVFGHRSFAAAEPANGSEVVSIRAKELCMDIAPRLPVSATASAGRTFPSAGNF